MRTTVTLEDDVLTAARALAEARGISLGQALSELARRGLAAGGAVRRVAGFTVFDLGSAAPAFGPEQIRAAEEKADLEDGAVFQR